LGRHEGAGAGGETRGRELKRDVAKDRTQSRTSIWKVPSCTVTAPAWVTCEAIPAPAVARQGSLRVSLWAAIGYSEPSDESQTSGSYIVFSLVRASPLYWRQKYTLELAGETS
jgi:hypothetical protein